MLNQDYLTECFKDADTVYVIIRTVARSGMSRTMEFYIVRDGRMQWITPLIQRLTGFNWTKNGQSIRVNGCGMDMAFHAVNVACDRAKLPMKSYVVL